MFDYVAALAAIKQPANPLTAAAVCSCSSREPNNYQRLTLLCQMAHGGDDGEETAQANVVPSIRYTSLRLFRQCT